MSQTGVGKRHVTNGAKAKASGYAQRARGGLPYDEAAKGKPVLLPAWAACVGSGGGLVAALPMPDELFLDIDDEADLKLMKENLAVLNANGFPAVVTMCTKSKSGNLHVRLKAPRELTPLERIALQAFLGSDRKREALSFLRHMEGKYAPTVFFETIKAAYA